MDEEKIFSEQASILEQIQKLISNRLTEIESISKQIKYPSKSEDERENMVNVFKVRSLNIYNTTLKYLINELKRDENYIFHFLLAHVRTFYDIFAKFLFLSYQDKNKQCLLCFCTLLDTCKIMIKNENLYKENILLMDNFLKENKITFPEYNNYSPTWKRKNDFSFPKTKDILTEMQIEEKSINTRNFIQPKHFYDIFSAISEKLHGNPYYYLEEPYNEKIWVIEATKNISMFLIEIIDLYTLNKHRPKDYLDLLKKIKKENSSFIPFWKNKINIQKNYFERKF